MGLDIKLNLSTDSIAKAMRDIYLYKQELKRKTSLFVQRLADLGITTIDKHKYSSGDSDFNSLRSYVWLEERGNSTKATLVLSGTDVAFIEFGAGVHYNGAGGTSPNPYGLPLGMVIGSYGQGHGLEDSWVYYDEDTARFRVSHGTEAAMPMYYADREIHNKFLAVAKEVFSNGQGD